MTEIMIRTGNPVPSSDARDRHDNSLALDEAVTGQQDSYTDRLGELRYTLKWMERAATGIPAVQAAIDAQSARDAILLSNGGIYESVASGLPATAVGKYFNVLDSNPDGYLILYQNVSGAAVERKRWPSKQLVDSIFEIVKALQGTGDVAFTFQDELGFIIANILNDGSLDLLKTVLKATDSDRLDIFGDDGFIWSSFGPESSEINGLEFKSIPGLPPGTYFMGEDGFIVGEISNDSVQFGVSGSVPPEQQSRPLVTGGQIRTTVIQVVGYGQSLSRGSEAVPILSTSQPYRNVMLASGLKARPGQADYDGSHFVPLIEQLTASNEGETPISGTLNGLVRRLIEGGEAVGDWKFAGTAAGLGGQPVENLFPGAPGSVHPYEKMVETIEDSKRCADAAGESYSVWAYTWQQGESNYSSASGDGRTQSSYGYAEKMIELFDTLTGDVVRITSQEFRPYLFTYQTAANRRYGFPGQNFTALAQWRLSKSRPDVVCVAPAYIFPVAGDNLHLSNLGSWLMGEYFSRAMHTTMISRGEKWRPLEPVSVNWLDNRIDVKFHVPSGALVIDGALAAITDNSGFDLWINDATREDIITSVEVTGVDTVRINLSSKANPASVLTYARGRAGQISGPVGGARGNIRDMAGDYDKRSAPNGDIFDLHNPCVVFQYSRTLGF